MAAGEGTRMRSSLPKMLHPVCGRPMITWPVLAAREAGAERVCVIVSPERDLGPALPDGTETVVQPQSDGTGGAIRSALDVIRGSELIVVVNGDHPLVTGELIASVVDAHREAGAAATVVTVDRDDPTSLGRVVRDPDGAFERIVETKYPEGIPAEILAIREVNTNTFVFDAAALADAIGRVTNDNAAGEYYIGDALRLIRDQGGLVRVDKVDDVSVNIGVNNRAELAVATAIARRRILERHMLAGVTVTDPETTWIEADVEIEADVGDRAGDLHAGRDPGRARMRRRPAHDADRLGDRSRGHGPALLSGRVRGRRPLPGGARTPICDPGRRFARAPRPGPSSRSRTPSSARGRRSPISPTSGTPTSARARTWGPGPSRPTTTVRANTARRSDATCAPGLTRRSSPP